MTYRTVITIGLTILLFAGCDDGFDPKGSFDKTVSLYAVLRTTTDSQFVRVHASYDPPAFDPLEQTTEPDLTSAFVALSSDSGTIMLSDSIIAHPDPLRYGTGLRIYFTAPFTPVRGLVYTLSATVPGYPLASGRAIAPRAPVEFRFTNTAILSSPRFYESQDINLIMKAPPEAHGYVARMFIEYEVRTATPFVEQREIPFRVLDTEGSSTPQYPDLIPLVSSYDSPFNVLTFWSFQTDAYRYLLSQLNDEYGILNLRFRRVVVYLSMVDESAYKYYNIVNGFRDDFTIRTDLPDYSNISGGVGVFGAISLDSLSVTVNSTILY